jgi:putative nucleotidyltransferase with HDIG domain
MSVFQQISDTRIDSVFERLYSGTLYIPAALQGGEGRRVGECLLRFSELPPNIGKLLAVLADEKSDSKMVAEVVELNPAVAAKLLKVVNSSYSGLRGKISNLKRAVTLFGYDNSRALILGMTAFAKSSMKILPDELPLGQLWKHSAAVGQISGILARKIGGLDVAAIMSAGLLHDIGKLIIAFAFWDRFADAIRLSQNREGELFEIELRTIGLTHPIIGASLCHHWNLPERLWGLIAAQEHPALGPDVTAAAVLKLAEFIARSHSIGADGQWAHGFVPDDICWYLGKSSDEVSQLICPVEIRAVVENVDVVSSWE